MFCDGSTAACRAASSDVTDVVLPANRRVSARLAAMHIVWRRRKMAGVDRIDRVGEPLLRVREDPGSLVCRGEQPDDAFGAFEGKVGRFAERPLPPEIPLQALLRAQSIDRQLERARPAGWPAQFVVDYAEGAVGEKVDAIRLAVD